MPAASPISSRHNPLYKRLRQLAQTPGAYRTQGQLWIEGEHLCAAALARGLRADLAVFAQSLWESGPQRAWLAGAAEVVVLADALFAQISALPSPARMGYVLRRASLLPAAMAPLACSVVLDRVQDAGNVGSILRSASALGFKQVLALQGTAALWSPKVLRAGMGAHFGLSLFENLCVADLDALQTPLLVAQLQATQSLHHATLPKPCTWVLGHEGQGVQSAIVQRAHMLLRIAQPGGEESLNVAAAAAICLHASAVGAA